MWSVEGTPRRVPGEESGDEQAIPAGPLDGGTLPADRGRVDRGCRGRRAGEEAGDEQAIPFEEEACIPRELLSAGIIPADSNSLTPLQRELLSAGIIPADTAGDGLLLYRREYYMPPAVCRWYFAGVL